MENYPSNSRKSKDQSEEPKKIEKVITGPVVRRKKSLGKRLAETFVGSEDARGVWGYVFYDVLIPAAKDAISDAVSQGIERMLFGEVRGRGMNHRRPGGSYTSYNRYSSPIRRDEPQQMSRRARATHDFDEIILDTKVEAEEVVAQLFELVSSYDVATVADLYELLGQQSQFTDDNWGWTDMRGAGVVRVKGGYLLDLPRPRPVER